MIRTKTISLFFILTLVIMSSCKKTAGPGGKNRIHGTVIYRNGVSGNNDAAATATVFITYGTDGAAFWYDKTILAGPDGSYSFEGLNKGNYFIKAEYTDAHGFKYNTNGYSVELKHKKKELEVNITLE